MHAHQLKCNGEATCIRGVYVEVPPFSQTVYLRQGGGIDPSNPSKDIFSIQKHGVATTLHLRPFGVTVSYDGSHRLEVMVPQVYRERLGGLCGNFNGNLSDDLQANVNDSLQLTSNLNEFGFSWRSDYWSAGNNCSAIVLKPSRCLGNRRDQAVTFCNAIFKQDSFRRCRGRIESAVFVDSCILDYCLADVDSDNFSLSMPCDSLVKFAGLCTKFGFSEVEIPAECSEFKVFIGIGSSVYIVGLKIIFMILYRAILSKWKDFLSMWPHH